MASAGLDGLVTAAVRAAILGHSSSSHHECYRSSCGLGSRLDSADTACQTQLSSGLELEEAPREVMMTMLQVVHSALLEALRAARASQRKRKKERRRAAKTAASTVVDEKGAQMQATLDPESGKPCQPASGAHVAKERDPQNPPKKKARDDSNTMAVVPSVEQRTLTCGTICVAGPTTTVRKIMDLVHWCSQHAKRTGRRKRSRPADKLPEGLVYTDDLGKTVLKGQARTVRGVARLINSWPGRLELS